MEELSHINRLRRHIQTSTKPAFVDGNRQKLPNFVTPGDLLGLVPPNATEQEKFALLFVWLVSRNVNPYYTLLQLSIIQREFLAGLNERHREEMPETGLLPSKEGVELLAQWILDELTQH